MRKNIPFEVSRNDARPLVRQVLDGMREAILGGYYTPGDEIPPYAELARILGVSQIVTKAVLKQLGEDGLVLARPRIGTVVRDRSAKQWRGRVVFVYDSGETGYFQSTLAEQIRVRLNAKGVLFTRSSVDRRGDGSHDFSLLDAALARSADMALVLYDGGGGVYRRLAKRGVPFAAIRRDELPSTAVGNTTLAYDAALRDFAAWCRTEGISDVVQLGWFRNMLDATPALANAGIQCRRRTLVPDLSHGKLVGIEEAGFHEFRRLAEKRRLSPNTLYFFTDDYLLRGAFQALLGTGLKVPGDIRIAMVSNVGAGPYLAQKLPRIEVDPMAIGQTIADATLSFLDGNGYTGGDAEGVRWIGGQPQSADCPQQPT